MANIVKSTKQMEILYILSEMWYILKNIESIEILKDGFYGNSTKHLAQRKNEIGLTVYELKTETWKKSIPPQNENAQPWNHNSNGLS